jgi:hypothetical protein
VLDAATESKGIWATHWPAKLEDDEDTEWSARGGSRKFASLFLDFLINDALVPHAMHRIKKRRRQRTQAVLAGEDLFANDERIAREKIHEYEFQKRTRLERQAADLALRLKAAAATVDGQTAQAQQIRFERAFAGACLSYGGAVATTNARAFAIAMAEVSGGVSPADTPGADAGLGDKVGGKDRGGGSAMGQGVMTVGVHYAEFDLLMGLSNVGVARSDFDPSAWDNHSRTTAADTPEGWCLRAATGQLKHDGNLSDWEGMEGIEEGGRIGLLFDCERQILVVYKPEDGSTPQFMGVLASGICGPLRWMAELVDGSSAVKVTGKQPPPLPPQVATISQPSPEPEQGLDEDPSEWASGSETSTDEDEFAEQQQQLEMLLHIAHSAGLDLDDDTAEEANLHLEVMQQEEQLQAMMAMAAAAGWDGDLDSSSEEEEAAGEDGEEGKEEEEGSIPIKLRKSWGDLTPAIQGAAVKLGFSEQSWPRLPKRSESAVLWDSLEEDQRTLAGKLGLVSEELWNHVLHPEDLALAMGEPKFYRKSWDELSALVGNVASKIGFTSRSWPRLPVGAGMAVPWDSLADDEKALAGRLGLTNEELWAKVVHPTDHARLKGETKFAQGWTAVASSDFLGAVEAFEAGMEAAVVAEDEELQEELRDGLEEARQHLATQKVAKAEWAKAKGVLLGAIRKAAEKQTPEAERLDEVLDIAVAKVAEAEAALRAQQFDAAVASFGEAIVAAEKAEEPEMVDQIRTSLVAAQAGRDAQKQARSALANISNVSTAAAACSFVQMMRSRKKKRTSAPPSAVTAPAAHLETEPETEPEPETETETETEPETELETELDGNSEEALSLQARQKELQDLMTLASSAPSSTLTPPTADADAHDAADDDADNNHADESSAPALSQKMKDLSFITSSVVARLFRLSRQSEEKLSSAALSESTDCPTPAVFERTWNDLPPVVTQAILMLGFNEASWPLLPPDGKTCVPWADLSAHEKNVAGKLGFVGYWDSLVADSIAARRMQNLAADGGSGGVDDEDEEEGGENEAEAEDEYSSDEDDIDTGRILAMQFRARSLAVEKYAEGQTALAAKEYATASWAFEAGLSAVSEPGTYDAEWMARLREGLLAAEGGKLALGRAREHLRKFTHAAASVAYIRDQVSKGLDGEQALARAKLAEGKLAAASHEYERAGGAFEAGLEGLRGQAAGGGAAAVAANDELASKLREGREQAQQAAAAQGRAGAALALGRASGAVGGAELEMGDAEAQAERRAQLAQMMEGAGLDASQLSPGGAEGAGGGVS